LTVLLGASGAIAGVLLTMSDSVLVKNILCDEVFQNVTGVFVKTLCTHKPLFPMNRYDWIGVIVLFTCSALASGGGVGGGGLFIPLLILINEFDSHTAMPISVLMVFVIGTVTTALNFKAKHPSVDRPLIDFTVVLYLTPASLLGKLH
jgi:hypothetical protein